MTDHQNTPPEHTNVAVVYYTPGDALARWGFEAATVNAHTMRVDVVDLRRPATHSQLQNTTARPTADWDTHVFLSVPPSHAGFHSQVLRELPVPPGTVFVDLARALKSVFNAEYGGLETSGPVPSARIAELVLTARTVARITSTPLVDVYRRGHHVIAEHFVRHTLGYLPTPKAKRGRERVSGGHVVGATPTLLRGPDLHLYDFDSHYPAIMIDEGLLSAHQTLRAGDAGKLEHALTALVQEKRGAPSGSAERGALKLVANAIYGTYAMPNSPLYNPPLASAITAAGRARLHAAIARCEQGGGTVHFGQTDSLLVTTACDLTADNFKHEHSLALAWIANRQRYAAIVSDTTHADRLAAQQRLWTAVARGGLPLDLHRVGVDTRRLLKAAYSVPGLYRRDQPLACNLVRVFCTLAILDAWSGADRADAMQMRAPVHALFFGGTPRSGHWLHYVRVSPSLADRSPDLYAAYKQHTAGASVGAHSVAALPVTLARERGLLAAHAPTAAAHEETDVVHWMRTVHDGFARDLQATANLSAAERELALGIVREWVLYDTLGLHHARSHGSSNEVTTPDSEELAVSLLGNPSDPQGHYGPFLALQDHTQRWLADPAARVPQRALELADAAFADLVQALEVVGADAAAAGCVLSRAYDLVSVTTQCDLLKLPRSTRYEIAGRGTGPTRELLGRWQQRHMAAAWM